MFAVLRPGPWPNAVAALDGLSSDMTDHKFDRGVVGRAAQLPLGPEACASEAAGVAVAGLNTATVWNWLDNTSLLGGKKRNGGLQLLAATGEEEDAAAGPRLRRRARAQQRAAARGGEALMSMTISVCTL
jgi:hypothetical protein